MPRSQPKQRTYIVLHKSDFTNPAVWYGLLDSLEVPSGKEVGWAEPETVELWTSKVETMS